MKDKQSLWAEIKQKDPKLAEFLKQARKDWPEYELKEVKFNN